MAMSICDTKSINMYVIKLANDPHPLKCLLEIPNDYLLFYIKQEARGPHLSPKTHFPAKTFIHPLFFFPFFKNIGKTILLMKYTIQ